MRFAHERTRIPGKIQYLGSVFRRCSCALSIFFFNPVRFLIENDFFLKVLTFLKDLESIWHCHLPDDFFLHREGVGTRSPVKVINIFRAVARFFDFRIVARFFVLLFCINNTMNATNQ